MIKGLIRVFNQLSEIERHISTLEAEIAQEKCTYNKIIEEELLSRIGHLGDLTGFPIKLAQRLKMK